MPTIAFVLGGVNGLILFFISAMIATIICLVVIWCTEQILH
jgi:hypothetical protein